MHPLYRILKEQPLQRGPATTVWLARDEVLQREIALKEFRGWASRPARARMAFQFAHLRQLTLSHPGLAPVHGVDSERGWVVQDVYSEGSLGELFDPLDFAQATRLLRDTLPTLQYLHQQGYLHAAVSPRNVFQTAERFLLADGLGLPLEQGQVAPGLLREVFQRCEPGHAMFLAPECLQSQSEPVGPAADLYALGLSVLQLLLSPGWYVLLFPAVQSAGQRWEEWHLSAEALPSLKELLPEVPTSLCSVVDGLIRKRPTERLTVAAALALLEPPVVLTPKPTAPPAPVRRKRVKVRPAAPSAPPVPEPAPELPRAVPEPEPSTPLSEPPADPQPAASVSSLQPVWFAGLAAIVVVAFALGLLVGHRQSPPDPQLVSGPEPMLVDLAQEQELRKQLAQLQHQVQTSQRALDASRQQQLEAMQRIEILQKELAEAQQQTLVVLERASTVNTAAEQKQGQAPGLHALEKARADQLEQQLQTARAELTRATAQSALLSTRVRELQRVSDELAQARAEIAQQKKQLAILQSSQEKLQQATAQIAQLQNQLTQSQEQLARSQDQFTRSQEQLTRSQQQLKALSALQESLTQANAEIIRQKDRLAQCQSSCATLERLNRLQAGEIQITRQDLTRANVELNRLRSQAAGLQQMLASVPRVSKATQPPTDESNALKALKNLQGKFVIESTTEGPLPRKLDLAGSRIGDHQLYLVAELPSLQGLSLSSTPISDAGLVHLNKLSQLQILHLYDTSITDAGLSHLARLNQLETLYLSSTKVSGTGLIHLKGLSQLQTLSLTNTRINDATLIHLRDLQGLRVLHLASTSLGNAGLAALNGLIRLEVLDLSYTPIGDEGMTHLRGLNRLHTLHLNYTQVGDAGLARLSGLTQLREISLTNTRVTERGIAQFRQALPNCRIIR